MASTTATTNYGLPVYDDDDIPSWKDTNNAFETIDSTLKEASDNASAALNLNGNGLTVAQYEMLGTNS